MFNFLRTLASRLLEGPPMTGEAVKIDKNFEIESFGLDPVEVKKIRQHLRAGKYFMIFDKPSMTVIPGDEFEKIFTFVETPVPGQLTRCKQTTSLWK